MTIRRPVMRYAGGKWKLAPWIISQFPTHQVYVEPFAGAASVLMRKPRVYAEVYNDLSGEVVRVFRVLRDPAQAAELARRVYLTPYARDEFEASYEVDGVEDPIERARLTIFRAFAGHGNCSFVSLERSGFRSNVRRAGSLPVHDWANYPSAIAAFVERLRGVVIENRPALDVIRQYDGQHTLHYVDPPYPHGTRNLERGNAYYAHEMTDDDHRALATVLRSVAGMVVISGYPCDLYDVELYPDWTRVTRAAHADGARDRVEVLWLSPGCERQMVML